MPEPTLGAMSERVALIDLGSNAARFLLAEIQPGVGAHVLHEERAQTRLGAGPRGTLPRQAIQDTLVAARRFLRSVRNGNSPRVLAVATAAVREAANRDRLLEPLRRRDHVDVRVLSGVEEARLAALAARRSLDVRRALVADLGGGSLQLARVRGGEVTAAASVPLGVIRLSRGFLRHDPPLSREVRALRDEIRDQVVGALLPAEPGESIVGIGGTVRALAAMHLRACGGRRGGRHGLRLRQSDITALRERLQGLSSRRRRRVPGLKAERADIIVAGAVVIEELMGLGGYLTLTVCMRGVRDGVLLREAFRSRS